MAVGATHGSSSMRFGIRRTWWSRVPLAPMGANGAAFNNAGVNAEAATMLDTSDDEFDRVVGVNLRGVWHKAELRPMLAAGSGAIANCASIGGLQGSRAADGGAGARQTRPANPRTADRYLKTDCYRLGQGDDRIGCGEPVVGDG